MGDIIVLAALALVVGLAVRSMYKDKKAGRTCGGSCSTCSKCSRGARYSV